MEKESTNQDILGNQFGNEYSLIITDFTFEKRLKAYDPNLRLMFDQRLKKWVILEWARDNSGWRILMKCEDDFGTPAAPGEWIFSHLNYMKEKYEKRTKDPNSFIQNMMNQAEDYKEKKQKELSAEAQYQIRHDIILWRKAFAKHQKLPSSDATAGFQFQPQPKSKGIICPQ